jgi:hypothetical protein
MPLFPSPLLHHSAKEFMTRDKSGKLKDTGVRFKDIAGGAWLAVATSIEQ